MVVLLDTNVLIDFLSKRKGFEQARRIVGLALTDKVECVMAAHSVINIFYILRRNVPPDKMRQIMIDLVEAIPVVSIAEGAIRSALERFSFSDFEDCIQDECASAVGAEYIVTRNVADFSQSEVPAITPEEFLAKLSR